MSQWYYSKDNQRQGPVSEEQLKQLAASGQLQPGDLVWKEGMSQWAEAQTVGWLCPTQATATPPPAPLTAAPAISLISMAAAIFGSFASWHSQATQKISALIATVLKWLALGIGGLIMVGVIFGILQENISAPQEAAGSGMACFFGIVARLMQAEEHFTKQRLGQQ